MWLATHRMPLRLSLYLTERQVVPECAVNRRSDRGIL
jgi:hypothetical protein